MNDDALFFIPHILRVFKNQSWTASYFVLTAIFFRFFALVIDWSTLNVKCRMHPKCEFKSAFVIFSGPFGTPHIELVVSTAGTSTRDFQRRKLEIRRGHSTNSFRRIRVRLLHEPFHPRVTAVMRGARTRRDVQRTTCGRTRNRRVSHENRNKFSNSIMRTSVYEQFILNTRGNNDAFYRRKTRRRLLLL